MLFESTPLIGRLDGRRHKVTLLLPVSAQVVQGLVGDLEEAGNLGNTFPFRRARALAYWLPHSVILK